ncbi:MAG: MBL fold metallo-hydrolase [Patescibacteria group bacterium]
MKLTFYGGINKVTGANYLLELDSRLRLPAVATALQAGGNDRSRFLVDCGLEQGGYYSGASNWRPFPYNPQEIKAVFITHSHIDHIGKLPRLYKEGFRGKVFSTLPCRDFAELLLYDSQHILSLEAERERKLLLYEEKDIKGLMKLWEGVEYYQPVRVDDLEAIFYNAGHILGSAFIKINNIVFSGDLGNSPAPIIGNKDELPEADYCLIEAAYGDRIHENIAERKGEIENIIGETIKAGGTLMIPAFAMERTQQLIFEIEDLVESGWIPETPIFVDSPLAIQLTMVYKKHQKYFTKKVIEKITPENPLLSFPGLKQTLEKQQSMAINDVPAPKVIIAGAGMMQGGRILHHLKRYLPDPKSALFIVGYQAENSLGRKILNGAKKVKIHGKIVSVKCRVKAIGGYSAHADQPQLLNWLRPQKDVLQKVFVVQGEAEASIVLAGKIRSELAVSAEIPRLGRSYEM